ncbi:sigma factor [Agrilactobacillus yilanensis]|uniref:Sigma factor n=1 Tax=Agrilactobacillus yilanensis TaxID=2485997 RepID=A0ABW4JAT3_9LACO|nr:sigma factor [Agrilactobacillus yilanensis]
MSNFDDENKLVLRVKLGDSDALTILIEKYKPLIFNMAGQYRLHLYDVDDWLQEARLECFLTAQKFDPSKGSKFGSFFKLRFRNSTLSKVRWQLAKKRKENCQATSLDGLLEHSYDFLPRDLQLLQDIAGGLMIDLPSYTAKLSMVELQALFVSIGHKDAETVQTEYHISAKALKSAQQRVRAKLRQYLQAEFGQLKSEN